MRPISVRHVTLLPQPLSPTSPRISPVRSENDTSSTARTTAPSVSMYVWRPETRRISSATSVTRPEEVGEAVAGQAEPDPDEDDGDSGQGREPPGREDVALPVGDHHTPLRRGRLRAEAEEAERRAEEDVPHGVDHREDDHERD